MDKHREAFIRHIDVDRGLDRDTLRTYNSILQTFERTIGVSDPKELTYSRIVDWRHERKQSGTKETTLNKDLSVIKQFCEWLHQKGIIDENEALKIASIKKYRKKRGLPSIITKGQLVEMFETCNPRKGSGLRDMVLISLLYFAGLRIGEVSNLKLADIVDNYKGILVTGKGGHQRYVPIVRKNVSAILKVWVEKVRPRYAHPEDDHLIVQLHKLGSGRKVTTTSLRDRITRLVRAAKIPSRVTPHTLRHSVATHLTEDGADIRFIQELLGHANIDTTTIYTQVRRTALTNTLNKHLPDDSNLDFEFDEEVS